MKNFKDFINESLYTKLRNPAKDQIIAFLKADMPSTMDLIEKSNIDYNMDAVNITHNIYSIFTGDSINWQKVYKRLNLTDGDEHYIFVTTFEGDVYGKDNYGEYTVIIDLGLKDSKTEKIYKYMKKNHEGTYCCEFNTPDWE